MLVPTDFPDAPGIYVWTNLRDGKRYVGQSKNIQLRLREHLADVNRGSRAYLYNAVRKYGLEAFDVRVVELCPTHQLNERERHWIATWETVAPAGYNTTRGGDANPMEHEYARAKMRATKQSAAARAQVRASMAREEVRRKLSAASLAAYARPGVKEKQLAGTRAAQRAYWAIRELTDDAYWQRVRRP